MHDVFEHSHHQHSHGEIVAFETTEQAVSVLTYMHEHNVSHAEELHEICHKLEAGGETEAAAVLSDAVRSFGDTNLMVETALQLLKKEKK